MRSAILLLSAFTAGVGETHSPAARQEIRWVSKNQVHLQAWNKKRTENLEVSFFVVLLSLKIVNISDILPMNVNVIDNIRQYFSTQPVRKAWLFGSFSRGEETAQSDVDILVEFDRSGKPVTLLTYARMWRELEERLGRNVDLVEDGTLKTYAVESANHDKRLIYERKD